MINDEGSVSDVKIVFSSHFLKVLLAVNTFHLMLYGEFRFNHSYGKGCNKHVMTG